MNDEHRWQTQLAARLHDPPEKALVLLRTREGHEGGTVQALLEEVFPQGVPADIEGACKRADRWASAADRAAFPKAEGDRRYPAWQQIRFADDPVLIHPLTGNGHRLQPLADDVAAARAQTLGTDHLRRLLQRDAQGAVDARRSALAMWRFGPELEGELAEIWKLLPADSRVPDHTIHDHLDLTAAFAGAFVADPDDGPALLAVSIGPVQDFIAAARSTSDLWAGSHLLARLAWEAMRVVCDACGPEAILFPRLRAVAQVDLWLVRDQGLPEELFSSREWRTRTTDANPLFAAALPNRFTALVPAARARELAQRIGETVRDFALAKAKEAFRCLLREAGIDDQPDLYGYAQIARQLQGFPEVHWAAVPWSLGYAAPDGEGRVQASDEKLAQAMRPFFTGEGRPGWLGTRAWELLSGGLQLDQGWFYRPNPGALYPALHELLERALGAVKSARPFAPAREEGWRCALTGEGEWITTDAEQLWKSYRQQTDTLWAKAAHKHPSWVKSGEHLSALPMLKRLWPTLYVDEVSDFIQGGGIDRFVVSTHTMAVASAIERALDSGKTPDGDMAQGERVALPRRLDEKLRNSPEAQGWRRVPGWLEAEIDGDEEGAGERARRRLAELLGARPDTYYGLLLLDGDDMGAWLSAGAGKTQRVASSFHPVIRQRLGVRFGGDPKFVEYARAQRAPNPAWHMAISEALNQFALHLVPDIVERRHLGRVIYAGGDDVLAMVSTSDLLNAAAQLRAAYSGIDFGDTGAQEAEGGKLQRLGDGWARFGDRVLRLMGDKATASAGLVIAHHQAPLSAVMRELRAAERRAKALAGKDAWTLAVLKRGGGALYVTAKWGEPLRLFNALRELLARDDVSRRAAFHVTEWLDDVPGDQPDMVTAMLGYQTQRQCASDDAKDKVRKLVPALVREAFAATNRAPQIAPLAWLADFMLAAEFLAREQRHTRLCAEGGQPARRTA
ncbi:MAG TPA: type III-B CRISPR-associated protein Cas10/Cmr2 [Gammaproteobacteria bacterium]|nr:type III-B CRISPR-associated protein Cas10/Cmr2 [Gammaproteobacteria bacterium]